jgi:hypothetical protein
MYKAVQAALFDPEPGLPSSLFTQQVRTVGKSALKMQETFSL